MTRPIYRFNPRDSVLSILKEKFCLEDIKYNYFSPKYNEGACQAPTENIWQIVCTEQ